MNLIMTGPQGCGKGTQAELLEKKYGLAVIDMGQILRSIAKSNNKFASIVKDHQDKGELVPDEYVLLIAWDHINKLSPEQREKGILFDGYPRSVPQYEHVKDMLMKFGKKLDRVIYLDISEAETVKRLSSRRTCEKCGNVYNLITNPSPAGEKCECGGTLIHRTDDQPEAIKRRLSEYHKQTMPVLVEARKDGILMEINGEQPIEKIHEEIVNGLGV